MYTFDALFFSLLCRPQFLELRDHAVYNEGITVGLNYFRDSFAKTNNLIEAVPKKADKLHQTKKIILLSKRWVIEVTEEIVAINYYPHPCKSLQV